MILVTRNKYMRAKQDITWTIVSIDALNNSWTKQKWKEYKPSAMPQLSSPWGYPNVDLCAMHWRSILGLLLLQEMLFSREVPCTGIPNLSLSAEVIKAHEYGIMIKPRDLENIFELKWTRDTKEVIMEQNTYISINKNRIY